MNGKTVLSILLAAGFAVVLLTGQVTKAVDDLISYQGFLTDDDGVPLNTTVSIEFNIYNVSTGGTALWDETHNSVSVTGGHFSVLLGGSDSFPDTIFEEDSLFLGIVVGNNSEMSPRREITRTAHSFFASTAQQTRGMDWDYDSQWTAISPGAGNADTLEHGLGGDPGLYYVYMIGKSTDTGTPIHQANFGGRYYPTPGPGHMGCRWSGLNSTSIVITRFCDDDNANYADQAWDYYRVFILKNQ